jgi:hypothetical protein
LLWRVITVDRSGEMSIYARQANVRPFRHFGQSDSAPRPVRIIPNAGYAPLWTSPPLNRAETPAHRR